MKSNSEVINILMDILRDGAKGTSEAMDWYCRDSLLLNAYLKGSRDYTAIIREKIAKLEKEIDANENC